MDRRFGPTSLGREHRRDQSKVLTSLIRASNSTTKRSLPFFTCKAWWCHKTEAGLGYPHFNFSSTMAIQFHRPQARCVSLYISPLFAPEATFGTGFAIFAPIPSLTVPLSERRHVLWAKGPAPPGRCDCEKGHCQTLAEFRVDRSANVSK